MNENPTTFDALLSRANAAGRPVILDGATGTELDNRGACLTPPIWSGIAALNSPDLLFQIHREYVEAGAEIITACSFRTTRRAFAKGGFSGDEWKDAARAAVEIATEAAAGDALVAGSVAPLEDCFLPEKAPKDTSAIEEHSLLCEALVQAGVDMLWLETFGTLKELESAMRAAGETGQGRVPFAVSVTVNASGNLISKESAADALKLAEHYGASAFLLNCAPCSHIEAALPTLKRVATIPIGAYANLGVAESSQDWSGSAYLAPDEYAVRSRAWGVDIVGACCGSTPLHIRRLAGRYFCGIREPLVRFKSKRRRNVRRSMERYPMTPNGHKQLTQELKNIYEVERPANVKAIEEARAHGDLSENAEYKYAKEQQSLIAGRIEYLEDRLSRAEVIDPSKLTGDLVVFGAKVTLENLTTAEEVVYRIVGEDEADLADGTISISSPIARGLIRKESGDQVTISTPSGPRKYEIVSVEF
jgi:transcription elongation factor GreA